MTQQRPALATLAEALRAANYRDPAARAYFGVYAADYHTWIAKQSDVHTDSDAIVALAGALVDNPTVRRAFAAARPELDRLLAVLDAADRSGQQLRPPAGTPRQYEDGSVGLEAAAQPGPPAPPPPPPAPTVSPAASPAASSAAPPPAPPTPPKVVTAEEALEEGRVAHDAGELLTDGPYPSGELGDAWETGWKRAKHAARDRRRHVAPEPAAPAAPAKPKPKKGAATSPVAPA